MKILGCEILENEPLSKYSYMKTGGNARKIVFPFDAEGLKNALTCEDSYVFGNCSNVLFPDDGLKKTIIITTKMKNITLREEGEYTYITAETGASLCSVAKAALEHSLTGLEFAHGIPGTVGGGVYMNAGAYGGEVKDVLVSCICFDKAGTEITLTKEEMKLSYRHSILWEKPLILASATFRLKKGNKVEIKEKMDSLMEQRRSKQPLEYPSCGSFFKRPEGYFAAKLIDDSGLKGFTVGGAQVSEKHSGFVINKGGATTTDILSLADKISDIVFEKFGVVLEKEVRVIEE